MRPIFVVLASALTLAACSGNRNDENSANVNGAADPNAQNMMITEQDGAMTNGAGGMDLNTATNAQTENQMAQDLNTNDKDTNLANGL